MKQYLLIGLCLVASFGFAQTIKPLTDSEIYFVTSDNKKIELGATPEQLFEILGPTTVKPSKKWRDKDYQYNWNGFTGYLFDANTVAPCLLMEVTGKQFATPRGIRVGDTAQKVKQKYGTPDVYKDYFLYYVKNANEPTTIGFTIKNDIVTMITYYLTT